MKPAFPFVSDSPIDTAPLPRVGKLSMLTRVKAAMPNHKGRLKTQSFQVPLSVFKLHDVPGDDFAGAKLLELNAGHVVTARHAADQALKKLGKAAVDGTTFTYNLAEGLYRQAQKLCKEIGHKITRVITSFPKLQLVIEPIQV
jgi:hypothetical protein